MFALVVALLLLAIQVHRLGARVRLAQTPLALAAAPSPDSIPKVIFVFRPGDCPMALNIIDAWNEKRRTGQAAVAGVMVTQSDEVVSAPQIVTEYGIQFPVRATDWNVIADRLAAIGIHELPVSLVFDGHGALRQAIAAATEDPSGAVDRALASLAETQVQ
jgi:hypothetical protein